MPVPQRVLPQSAHSEIEPRACTEKISLALGLALEIGVERPGYFDTIKVDYTSKRTRKRVVDFLATGLGELNLFFKPVHNSFRDPGPLVYGKNDPLCISLRHELDAAFEQHPAPGVCRAVRSTEQIEQDVSLSTCIPAGTGEISMASQRLTQHGHNVPSRSRTDLFFSIRSLPYASMAAAEEATMRSRFINRPPPPFAWDWPAPRHSDAKCISVRPELVNVGVYGESLLHLVPLLGATGNQSQGTIPKLLLATLALSRPALAAPTGFDYKQKLVDDLKTFATTASELIPGVILTGGYQCAVWRIIESGAQQPAADETDAQAPAQHRAYYQGAQSLGCVVLFVAADGWGWADDHAIEFKGLAVNCVAALCIYHYYQYLAHRTWSSKAHGLVQLLMLAFFGAILYSLGHGSWIALVWWSITCLYPLGARLNINTLVS